MKSSAEFRGLLTGLALVGLAFLVLVDGPTIIPGQELLQSLRFHIAAGMLVIVVLLVMSRAWWRGVLLLALLLASAGQGGLIIYRQQESRAQYDSRPEIAQALVLNFNVLASNERGSDIADYMIATAPDVMIVMESNAIQPERARLAVDFPYTAGCNEDGRQCDTMIFSRTPLSDVQVIPLEPFKRLRLIVARTRIKDQDVTLIAAHLSKPYFDEASYGELGQIRRLLKGLTGPIILSGDFNAAAWSYPVASLAENQQLVPPPNYPATWPVELGAAAVPIDNMFTRDGARIDSIEAVPDAMGSNHRSLLARVGFYAAQ